MKAKFRMSKTSKVLVGCYLLVALICIVIGLSVDDPKGGFVFLQLPIALQLSVLPDIALDFLHGLNLTGVLGWLLYYFVFGGLTVLLLILIGNFIDKR